MLQSWEAHVDLAFVHYEARARLVEGTPGGQRPSIWGIFPQAGAQDHRNCPRFSHIVEIHWIFNIDAPAARFAPANPDRVKLWG